MWSGRLSWKGWGPKNRCFQIVILEKTLESPLDCKEINHKGNHSWIFFGRTDAEAEAPMSGHLMWRADSLEKTLMLGKTEGKRRRGWQWTRWLDSITNSMGMNLSRSWEIVEDTRAWHAAVHGVAKAGHDLATEQQQQTAHCDCDSLGFWWVHNNDIAHLFIHLSAIWVSGEISIQVFCPFLIGLSIFLLLSYKSSSCILGTSSLLDMSSALISSPDAQVSDLWVVHGGREPQISQPCWPGTAIPHHRAWGRFEKGWSPTPPRENPLP